MRKTLASCARGARVSGNATRTSRLLSQLYLLSLALRKVGTGKIAVHRAHGSLCIGGDGYT